MTNLALTEFPLVSYDKLRYGDTDRQGHVNNAVFATFLETGRVELTRHGQNPLHDNDGEFVLVKLNLNLSGEIRWPGEVHIGTGVMNIGNSSLKLFQQIFHTSICVAFAETVLVQINSETRKPQSLSDKSREALEKFKITLPDQTRLSR
jgi:acyl-CoA thioester hydrolase